jgi:hypothetical protein
MYSRAIDKCFEEMCVAKIKQIMDDYLDDLGNDDRDSDEEIEQHVITQFGDMFCTKKECYKLIDDNMRVFNKMIKFIRRDETDYAYDGNVKKMFNKFIVMWIKYKIIFEDYNIIIQESFEDMDESDSE